MVNNAKDERIRNSGIESISGELGHSVVRAHRRLDGIKI